MHQWLNDPEIVQWWEGDDVTWAGVVTDYSPEREPDGVEHWIASLDDRPIGWISCGDVAQWPDESARWTALGGDRLPHRRSTTSSAIVQTAPAVLARK